MKKIIAITIALFSIGCISAILVGYDYFTTIHVISKQQAIALAIKYGQWSPLALENYTIDAKLLQAKPSVQKALVLNDTAVRFEPYSVILRTFYVKENQLFWEVTITKHFRVYDHDWIYDIDAMNGTKIESWG